MKRLAFILLVAAGITLLSAPNGTTSYRTAAALALFGLGCWARAGA